MLKQAQNDKDIEQFGKYKLALIKEHQYYANKLGLYDIVVDNYNIDDALKHIGEKNYFQFLIIENNESVGIVEYKIMKSEIDNKEILYLKNIYIEKKYRGIGLGRKVLNELKKLNYRIELECWYGMPANNFYKSFGCKELKTRYMFENE